MEFINISHNKIMEGSIHKCSSELSEAYSAKYLLVDQGYWSSQKRSAAISEYFIIDYHKLITINFIRLDPSPGGEKNFPRSFRIETSLDGETWEVVHSEREHLLESDYFHLDLHLTQLQYLKVVIMEFPVIDSQYWVELGSCICGISGVVGLDCSSTSSGSDVQNLLSTQIDAFWESQIKTVSSMEFFSFDLGQVFNINRLVLCSSIKGFPEDFTVLVSTDNELWMPLFDCRSFKSEPYKKYYWNSDIRPARYIRLEVRGVKYFEGQYAVRISGVEIFAAPANLLHTHNYGELTQHASVFQAGIVKLARDGDERPGTAVQGSDRRLRDATTVFKGIVQFAEDGDDKDLVAVQASDSRLKEATESQHGIARLAYDREVSAGAVVQSNDSRLREATLNSFGIVRLCPPGLYSENSVVLGNDPRLEHASTESSGICILSEDGGSDTGKVVQANDRRLRDATVHYKGIMQFAEDGECIENKAVQSSDRRLKDATTMSRGIVELAEDGEDSPGVVVQGHDRRLRDATTTSKGIAELAENGEDRPGVVVQGNDRRLKDATVASKGIVELADDGEDRYGVVVQGNDRRLKKATESTEGIVRLAKNGEESPLCAVQGNDCRLKNATTISKGIVELAEDGEDSPAVAVQGNDRRLKDATTKNKGIVELAEDGEDRPGVAVQGNDRRLKEASEKIKGIMRFAADGEVAPSAAVQGGDRRLKDATTTSKGIVELAEDGEQKEGVVVQGSDRRLKDATTTSKGIVELAEDGEDSEGVAVQGNDRRLKRSTEENTGIVKLAKNKEEKPGIAVQADDERLSNDRNPLPHTHDYAPLVHDYNSHTGAISVKQSRNEVFREITPPSDNTSVIYGQNESKESGSIGIAGVAGLGNREPVHTYGVVGHSSHIGVRGQSSGSNDLRGCGVMGISRFGAGGVFASENAYSLIADGYGALESFDKSVNLMGNGEALLVKGKSEFHGPVEILKGPKSDAQSSPMNIVELFEVDDEEFLSPGDLLVVSESGKNILSRSRRKYNRSVIGIISGNPVLVINNSMTEKKVYPVALAGRALCKVDAREKPVVPGDLIVTSDTPGCGMSGAINSFEQIGTVIGKALDGLEGGIGVIPVYIVHL
ncbi:MAG TPA: discoidin domain-containing protein [Spirochaetota bacterium]|nr:discoidin domain-containing protein [Spirochaetota bacterium]HPI87726.1 discoidin domain-containing protein [Spirochaetota bacterium]HPR48149.1 discoidin domain-containing protein [Spirochaetota bacterium]